MKTDLAHPERAAEAPPPAKGRPTRLLIIAIDAPFLVTHRLPLACAAAREAGFDVHIAAPIDPASTREDERARQRIEAEGLTFHRIPLKRSSMDPWREWQLVRVLDALIDTIKPDLIHCVGMKPVLYAGALARLKRLPAVHAVTGLGHTFMGQTLPARLRRFLLMRFYAFAFGGRQACVIVQNPDDRALFAKAHAIEPRRTFLLRGTGADLTRFKPRTAETASKGEPLVVMLAARLIEAKGIRDFVAAAETIRVRGGVQVRFVLLGTRDAENPTCVAEADLERWHATGVIEWWGHSDDMPDMLRKADVFCLPSWYREGIPKVLIEAAASGLPIVTTDMPGCREVVRDSENGFLVPPRDPKALVAALLRLLEDPALRHRFAVRAREIAVAEFSLDAFLTASLAVYRAALETRKPS